MTDDDLSELERLAERATMRPWYARGQMLSRHPDGKGMGGGLHTNHVAIFADRDDAAFVAALVVALPGLVDRVRRAEAPLRWKRACEVSEHGLYLWAHHSEGVGHARLCSVTRSDGDGTLHVVPLGQLFPNEPPLLTCPANDSMCLFGPLPVLPR